MKRLLKFIDSIYYDIRGYLFGIPIISAIISFIVFGSYYKSYQMDHIEAHVTVYKFAENTLVYSIEVFAFITMIELIKFLHRYFKNKWAAVTSVQLSSTTGDQPVSVKKSKKEERHKTRYEMLSQGKL